MASSPTEFIEGIKNKTVPTSCYNAKLMKEGRELNPDIVKWFIKKGMNESVAREIEPLLSKIFSMNFLFQLTVI